VVASLPVGVLSMWPVRVSDRVGLPYSNGAVLISSFLDLGISSSLVERIVGLGITDPLPIQELTIPDALAGRDVCGQAPTGSGKTLAFGVPLVVASTDHRARPGAPRALVLVPTRELAQQVATVLGQLMPGPHDRVTAIYGGTGYEHQRRALRRGVDIVVACPGRLEDLMAQGDIRLDAVSLVVLDEADRMVDMGFFRPVCRILDRTADGRQLLLFSATMTREVTTISRKYQQDPCRHDVEPTERIEGAVTHLFWRAERNRRVDIAAQLIVDHGQAFVFCRTKRGADRVARQLRDAGVEAAAIHGDRTQAQRAKALASFTAGRTHALVGTDVVARGIDVDDVPCVIHYDPAGDANTYVHRSGRTGRAGRDGTVVSLVPDDQHGDVRVMQRSLGLEAELVNPFTEHPVVLTPALAPAGTAAGTPMNAASRAPGRRQRGAPGPVTTGGAGTRTARPNRSRRRPPAQPGQSRRRALRS